MSKELKALKELKKRYGKNFSLNDDERCHIIESALKDKEQIDMLLEQFGLSNIQNFIDNLKIVAREQKKLNALEIIKKKRINVGDFMIFVSHKENTLELWNSYFTSEKQLTQEEYEILKEELL